MLLSTKLKNVTSRLTFVKLFGCRYLSGFSDVSYSQLDPVLGAGNVYRATRAKPAPTRAASFKSNISNLKFLIPDAKSPRSPTWRCATSTGPTATCVPRSRSGCRWCTTTMMMRTASRGWMKASWGPCGICGARKIRSLRGFGSWGWRLVEFLI